MLSFLKRIFGSTQAETPVPYKVETPAANKPSEFPFPSKTTSDKSEKKTAVKKPAVKAKTARKPRAPKA